MTKPEPREPLTLGQRLKALPNIRLAERIIEPRLSDQYE